MNDRHFAPLAQERARVDFGARLIPVRGKPPIGRRFGFVTTHLCRLSFELRVNKVGFLVKKTYAWLEYLQ